MSNWHVPEKYRNAIRRTERDNRIPFNMLARLLWQNTRGFQEDIINGKGRHAIGALGIAALDHKTAQTLGLADRRNPWLSIIAAGKHLHELRDLFGSWEDALLAYRWSAEKVRAYNRAEGDARDQGVPVETREYVARIMADSY